MENNIHVKKNKILVVGKLPPPYMGPAIATKIILNSKLKDEFDLIHFDVTINKTIKTQGKKSVKKVLHCLKKYIAYCYYLFNYKPDIVLEPFAQESIGFFKDIPYLLLPKLVGAKVIGQLRGSNFKTWIESSFFFTKKIVIGVLKKTDGVIVLGEKLKYLFEDIYDNNKIFVVPNGANYNIPLRTKTSDKIKILFLAQLTPNKGVIDVVEASSLIKEKKNEFELILFGTWVDTEIQKYCIGILNKSLIEYKIIPSSQSEAKFDYLVNSDIFVFPPRAPEGHPWVIVEALAAGLPIVSTDQGAITESVINGVNGFIVDPKNPEQISEKIMELIKNPQLRASFGKNSRKIYEERFNEDTMVKNYTSVFRTIIKDKSS